MEFSSSNLHLWRLGLAVSWSILVQFILLCIYISAMNVDISDQNVFALPFKLLFSMKTLYIIPLAAILFFQGIVFSRDYVKPPNAQFINKRCLLLFGLFSYENLIALSMYISLGTLLSYVYASVSKTSISSISVECFNEESDFAAEVCLNEKKFFLILAGLWTGFYCFIKDCILNSKTLIFPPIQQHKFVRIKSTFFSCLKGCMISSVLPSILFCILYYVKGSVPRSYFCALTGLSLPHNLLDTVYVLLDKELMFYLWIFTTLYMFTLEVMNILFNIHLTERAYFPITTFTVSSKSEYNNLLLQDALAAEKIPIIQHLGALDLALLSQFDSQRRAELFMLSQPGGHPHSWNAIVNECFKMIDKFTDELDVCIDNSRTKRVNKSEQPAEKAHNSSSHTCHQRSHNMRNLSIKSNIDYYDQSPVFALQNSYERLVNVYHEWLNRKLDAFYKKPFIAYFFGEMTEPKIKHLLLQSQLVIWAVESLSLLICHSVKEDNFGVAQKDLPKTIVSLLHLKNSLDKLQKQSIFIKKSNKLDIVNIQMKNALKFSVKQSIYRIAIAFKEYIHDINLHPVEYIVQMRNFVEFKEV